MRRPLFTALVVAAVIVGVRYQLKKGRDPKGADAPNRGPRTKCDGIDVSHGAWNRVLAQLTPRAAFDLACGEAALEFQLFNADTQGWPLEIGVVGDGQRALYIRQSNATAGEGAWLLNSSGPVDQPFQTTP